jgi:uncharacterized protein DUF1761
VEGTTVRAQVVLGVVNADERRERLGHFHAAVAVLVVSTVWYSAFSKQMAELSPAYADAATNARPPSWKVAVELLRSLVVATVVAGLAARLDILDWTGGALLGLALWIGLPVVLWTGAVMWGKSVRSSAPSTPATGS